MGWSCSRWSSRPRDGAQEGERAVTVGAEEGFFFGDFGEVLGALAEEETHGGAGFLSGRSGKAKVTHAMKIFG